MRGRSKGSRCSLVCCERVDRENRIARRSDSLIWNLQTVGKKSALAQKQSMTQRSKQQPAVRIMIRSTAERWSTWHETGDVPPKISQPPFATKSLTNDCALIGLNALHSSPGVHCQSITSGNRLNCSSLSTPRCHLNSLSLVQPSRPLNANTSSALFSVLLSSGGKCGL